MDSKLMAELEALYSGVEGWTEQERKNNIRFAYNSVMAQREAQARYGAVDANDPEAVRAAVEKRKAENGGTVTPIRTPGQAAVSGGVSAGKEYTAAADKAVNAIDRATKAAVAEVENSVAEAEEAYQAQRDAVELQAAQSRDNSALYSQLRGDKGGIGKAQYDSVQNTAARSHAQINLAQTAMARAAAAEIAGLQAKGEYEKAEKLLDLAQERLSALLKLEERSADEAVLQEELRRWQAEYDLQAAKLTGYTASGEPTADTTARLAALGEAMLKKGLMPSNSQLKAMGMTAAQAREYINIMKARD